MKVREELAGFVALQRLLERRAALRKERDTPPAELLELRSAHAGRNTTLKTQQARQEALSSEQRTLQAEADALREERDHFRKQKSQVTNMKQLTAVVTELDFVEQQLKAKEDRLLEIMAELESLKASVEELSAESPEEREQREAAEATWEVQREAVSGQLQDVDRDLRHVQRSLGAEAMARFKKLWTSRKPLAVVPLDETACSACHAELRPALVQLVRAAETMEYCDTCRRLLYDPEQFPS